MNLWRRATDVLVALRSACPADQLPLPDGSHCVLARADAGVLQIETQLLLDWYWPAVFGAPTPADIRKSFDEAWRPVFECVLSGRQGWLLRDYHSPNLIALDDRSPPRDIGIIDFQDAMIGPEAYDLVSLLQDARVDVHADVEHHLLSHYCDCVRVRESDFDQIRFRADYAALGAQRNTKILGIFARLAMRDGKRQYLSHIPRIWSYLARNLAHESLAPLAAWYDRNLPDAVRARTLRV